jgi:class 3 adenylate cyclase
MTEERRLVTVVFADVVGSTTMGERLDPEDMRLLLGRFYEIARDVVADHGGVLEKFIGDAAMAIFGAPRAHDDDASRALAAALELRDRVRADPELAEQLPIRIGVNTGEVIAAAGGADPSGRDFIVTGDAVNVAARLQQGAKPWAVLVGERTVGAVRDGFRFGPAVDVEAKGKADTVRARPLRGRAPGGRRLQTPLFGRETELEQLEIARRRAFADARPFHVTLIAPPGTGKTRLVQAFLDGVRDRESGASVAVARCAPYGERLTYWPLRSLLSQLTGGAPENEPPDQPAVTTWLRRIGATDPEETAELLAATVGATEVEAADAESVHEAWQRAIAAAARDRPLILVFEDIHWASDSLLQLIDVVTLPRDNTRLLTVALARPELLDRRPQWGAGRVNWLNATLEPLPRPAMRGLVESLLEDPAPHLVDAIVERAEGNPFFAGEMVRSVLERASSTQAGGEVERVLDALPDTVQATVMSRLDLLNPADRHHLQIAAVLGKEFRADDVAALVGGTSHEAVNASLRLSAARELLDQRAGGTYAFRHVLIRDGAYQTLPRGERARLHAAAARLLEEKAGETAAELIAYHYREAATAPTRLVAERSPAPDLRYKAVDWLSRAAQQASNVAASVEAAAHLRAALELADETDQAALWEALGDVHLTEESAADAYERALALATEQHFSADRELRIIAELLLVHTRSAGGTISGGGARIPELVERGTALLPVAQDARIRASFEIAQGFIPFSARYWMEPTGASMEEARRHAETGLAAAEQIGDANLMSAALDALGAVALTAFRWEELTAVAMRRIEMADRLAPIEAVDAHATAAWAASALGRIREAEAITAAGLTRVRAGQAPTYVLHLLTWRTYALTLLGRWDEVTECADRAHELWLAIGRGPAHFTTRGYLAAHSVAIGRRDLERAAMLRSAIEEIWSDDDAELPVWRAYMEGDAARLHAYIAGAGPGGIGNAAWRPEIIERLLGLCCDRKVLPPIATLESTLSEAESLRMVALQARRAIALSRGDAADLAAVLAACDAEGVEAIGARVRCELAQLRGDEGLLAEGIAALEWLGDVDQRDRVLERHASP